jgi:hypothetical protein
MLRARGSVQSLLSPNRAQTGGNSRKRGMAAMPEAVFPLDDEELRALAHFLAGLF